MNVVYLIQAGPDGPIKIGLCNDRALTRRLASLQDGNPTPLHLRAALHDPQTEDQEQLLDHLAITGHDLLIRDSWYEPTLLDQLPADVDDVARRQVAAAGLAALLNNESTP